MKKLIKNIGTALLTIAMLLIVSYLAGCKVSGNTQWEAFYPHENGPSNKVGASRQSAPIKEWGFQFGVPKQRVDAGK